MLDCFAMAGGRCDEVKSTMDDGWTTIKCLLVVWGIAWVFFITQIVRAAQFQAANPGQPFVIGPNNGRLGHWSPVTSNIDWCEENYAVTQYIAEFWNTLSSGLFVVMAVLGGWQTRKLGVRYVIPFTSLAVVGLGSMYFHSTLSRLGQDLDEGPMACLGASLIFVGHFSDKPVSPAFPRGPKAAALVVYALVVIAALVAFPTQNAVFLVLFIPSPTYAIYRASTIYGASNASMKKQIRFAMACAVLSWLGWGVEPVICGSLFSKVQLHAWWHIGVCIACFLYIHVTLNVEQTTQGKKTTLGTIIPYTVMTEV